MNISQALHFFEDQVSKTENTSEIKAYQSFIGMLKSLQSKSLEAEELQRIEDELNRLDLEAKTDNQFKALKRKISEFKHFLSKELSLVSENHYTGLGIALGTSFGLLFGIIVDSIGLPIGMVLGMAIGIAIGKQKDQQAEKSGLVLKI